MSPWVSCIYTTKLTRWIHNQFLYCLGVKAEIAPRNSTSDHLLWYVLLGRGRWKSQGVRDSQANGSIRSSLMFQLHVKNLGMAKKQLQANHRYKMVQAALHGRLGIDSKVLCSHGAIFVAWGVYSWLSISNSKVWGSVSHWNLWNHFVDSQSLAFHILGNKVGEASEKSQWVGGTRARAERTEGTEGRGQGAGVSFMGWPSSHHISSIISCRWSVRSVSGCY